MAHLAESYPVPYFDRENFNDVIKKQNTLIKELQKESDKATEKNPVGFLLTFPVADGQAFFRVVKARPLTVQHVPVGDAYSIPDAHIRGLNISDVKKQIEWRKSYESK